MIPAKIKALFEFIDYLDSNKTEYIETYLPLCDELIELGTKRSELNPAKNYRDKLRYDEIQSEISEKFKPITQNICVPVLNKLQELDIWAGDDTFSSIWNNNISEVSDFKRNFSEEDIQQVMQYKVKYLDFRVQTNSNFLCLQFVFQELDEILKQLFDFFKDTDKNEFDHFETKTIEVDSLEDAIKGFVEAKGKNVVFTVQNKSLLKASYQSSNQPIPHNIIKELIMGDKIEVGNISNNSGQIIIGKDITISDSITGRNETCEKITELITIIRRQNDVDEEYRQSLITNFDKVKDELAEDQPSKSKIYKWLSVTKELLEKLVFSHEVTEAAQWVYKNLNFIFHS